MAAPLKKESPVIPTAVKAGITILFALLGKLGYVEQYINFVKDRPWSVIQLVVIALIAIACVLQYIVLVMGLLFEKRLEQVPNGEYEDLSRKDAHMMVVRILNMNPMGINVPYPWLVYMALFSALLVMLALLTVVAKVFYARSSPEFEGFKRLGKDAKRISRLTSKLEDQLATLAPIDPQDYEELVSDINFINDLLVRLQKLEIEIENDMAKANVENNNNPIVENTAFSSELDAIEAEFDGAISAIKTKTNTSKKALKNRKKGSFFGKVFKKNEDNVENDATDEKPEKKGMFSKMFKRKEEQPEQNANEEVNADGESSVEVKPDDVNEATQAKTGLFSKMFKRKEKLPEQNANEEVNADGVEVKPDDVKEEAQAKPGMFSKMFKRKVEPPQQGGANDSELPEGGKFTPNYELLLPVVSVGLILMMTGLYTFVSFVMKIQKIRTLSDDAQYETIIKQHIPRNEEFLGALKELVVGSTKLNPYTWPPRKIEKSFELNNPTEIDEIVKMMFLYRLASHYVRNIASLEEDSKAYAAKAVAAKASRFDGLADNIGNFLGIMATRYVTDMAPLKRFKGDQSFDDVRAMSEIFTCPQNKCPAGKGTFMEVYRKNTAEITRRLEAISYQLTNIIDSPNFTLRLVSQYKVASDYLDMFKTLNVFVPISILLVTALYCWFYIEKERLRNSLTAVLCVLAVFPFIVRMFVDWR